MLTSAGIPVLDRGVHRLPFWGPKGEWQLVAVDSQGRQVAYASVRTTTQAFKANDRLWSKLYRADPQ